MEEDEPAPFRLADIDAVKSQRLTEVLRVETIQSDKLSGRFMNKHRFPAPPQAKAIDDADQLRFRHARERHSGFPVGAYLQPPPMLFSRDGHNLFLADMYRGHSAFLIGAGPSLTSHDLSLLKSRGVLTMSMNNAATVVHTNLWVSVDDPGNFCDAIWYDPAIMKFVPLCHMEKHFMVRNDIGELVKSPLVVGDMPTIVAYRRNENFVAEQWLYEDTFNWGNHSQKVDAHGNKGSRSVMYVALRLLFYLGVRRVFLLGCDFKMEQGKQNYAFEQDRSGSSVRGNNSSYQIMNSRFAKLLPYFEAEGFQVYNCTPGSGLTVFPYVDFEAAIESTRSIIPSKINTAGMYDRNAKEGKKSETQRVKKEPAKQVKEPVPPATVHDPKPGEVTILTRESPDASGLLSLSLQQWCEMIPMLKNCQWLVGSEEKFESNCKTKFLKPEASTAQFVRQALKKVKTPWVLFFSPDIVSTARQACPIPEALLREDLSVAFSRNLTGDDQFESFIVAKSDELRGWAESQSQNLSHHFNGNVWNPKLAAFGFERILGERMLRRHLLEGDVKP